MIVDHTLTPMQNLLNLINETNDTDFTVDDFVMLELTQTDFTENLTVKNTSVLVTCTLNNEFYGNQEMTYRRLYVQEIIKANTYAVQPGDTLASILLHIADRFLLIPSELEWDAPTLDVAVGETKPYTLRAKVSSLCYIGELDILITRN